MEAATRLKLWEITDELDAIGEALAESGGELSPELEAELDALQGALEEKVERIALFIRECEANADATEAEERRLAAIRNAFQSKAKGLKSYLLAHLERTGRSAVNTPLARVRIQANSRPSIRFAGSEIPEEFRRVEIALDGQRAYEAWKAGTPLPEGFVVDLGRHLRIA